MTTKCPKCGYVRQATDRSPDYECPNCGIVYAKFDAAADLRKRIERAEATGVWQGIPPEHVPLHARSMLVELATTPELPGRQIKRSLGLVGAECAYGMNVLKDIVASVTDAIGGRSGVTQGVLKDARAAVIADMRAQAHAMGAHAIVGISFSFNEFSGAGKSMLFVAATGTAVELQNNN